MSKMWAAFGVLPGGSDEEVTVQACLARGYTYLSEQDQAKFRKEFNDRDGDNDQCMDTFRELLAGVFMARQGFTPRYTPKIGRQTPDWHFVREGVGEFVAEFMNFQSPDKINAEQKRALEGDGSRVWCDWMPSNVQRLWSAMQKKAAKYKELAAQEAKPYVVMVFGKLGACLLPEEVEQCILGEDGLFKECPHLSGVYNMVERSSSLNDPAAGYQFHFYPNPDATRPAPWLSSGLLTYRFRARSDEPKRPV
jgi:hypothetical protein